MTEHEEQQLPTANEGVHIHDLVAEDHQGRKALGIERYGTPLGADNGRDALRDAYEEALDLAVYLRQAIEERNLQLGALRLRLENAVPDSMSTGDRKGVLDAVVELVLPFVAVPNRPVTVRWHDTTGETWIVEPGKTMQFPGGVGVFSLSFGEEKVEQELPSPAARAADAAWDSFVDMRDYTAEPDLKLVHEALLGVDEGQLDTLLGMASILTTAIVQRKAEAVRAKLHEQDAAPGARRGE